MRSVRGTMPGRQVRLTVTTAMAVAVTLAASGCSDDGDEDASAGASTVTVTDSSTSPVSSSITAQSVSTTRAGTSTASTSRPSTTSAGPASGLPTDTGEYADAFVRAWGVGDRQDAARYASADAVTALFSYDGRGGSTWARDTTAQQGGRTQVRYTDGQGGSLYVLVDRATVGGGQGGAVVAANIEYDDLDALADEPRADGFQTDDYDDVYGQSVGDDVYGLETTTADYADAFVRAWGAGDGEGVATRGTEGVVEAMWGPGYADAGWSRTSIDGSTATYTHTGGRTLTLELDATRVAAGRGGGVVGASFSPA